MNFEFGHDFGLQCGDISDQRHRRVLLLDADESAQVFLDVHGDDVLRDFLAKDEPVVVDPATDVVLPRRVLGRRITQNKCHLQALGSDLFVVHWTGVVT